MPAHRLAFGSGQRTALLNILLVSIIEYLLFKGVLSEIRERFPVNAYPILSMIDR